MLPVPLQFSFFLNYAPPWLAPILIVAGVLFILYDYWLNFSPLVTPQSDADFLRLIAIGVGVVLLLVPALYRYTSIAAFGFFLLGRWIQGLAAINSIHRSIVKMKFASEEAKIRTGKVAKGTAEKPTTSSVLSIVSGFLSKNKAIYISIGYIILLFTLWLAAVVIAPGTVIFEIADNSIIWKVGYDLRVVWTGYVVVTSVLTLSWKFFRMSFTDDDGALGLVSITGLLLIIVGAEIYNFTLLVDITSLIVGGIVFFIAVIYATMHKRRVFGGFTV